MSDKKKRNQFTFVESEETAGLVERIDKLAKETKRKRNNWVGFMLSKLVETEETKARDNVFSNED